ncbi:MAG: DUF2110 family protein, partial [Candidatus Hermodarchaeota archaeon]
MKKLVLFDKIYNIPSEKQIKEIYVRYLKYLEEYTKSFPNTGIIIKKMRKFDNRFEILIQGPEEIFVYNLLKKEVGSIIPFNEIEVGKIYKGNLTEVGKYGFGLFADCAIFEPPVDVLISLKNLREQLCKGKKLSLREIVKIYDFIDHFPVTIEITKMDKINQKLRGKFDDDTLEFYKKLTSEKLESVFVSGATKNQLKNAIIKTGHLRDIVSIERYGFFEQLAILKKTTEATGIISEIG